MHADQGDLRRPPQPRQDGDLVELVRDQVERGVDPAESRVKPSEHDDRQRDRQAEPDEAEALGLLRIDRRS